MSPWLWALFAVGGVTLLPFLIYATAKLWRLGTLRAEDWHKEHQERKLRIFQDAETPTKED